MENGNGVYANGNGNGNGHVHDICIKDPLNWGVAAEAL
ncbi:hypothetical protein Tco_0737404, partial [Tanacetum coccineum]